MPTANFAALNAPQPTGQRNPALRLVDAALAKIAGVPVTINEAFRSGLLMLDPENQRITCSSSTLAWLDSMETNGGAAWRKCSQVIHHEIGDAGEAMKATMVDVGARVGLRVVDRRRVTRPTNDRLDFVCKGIADLTAQMAPFCDGRTLSGNQVQNFAKRYGELRDEMAQLRMALAEAEGRFEVAQKQIITIMDGQE